MANPIVELLVLFDIPSIFLILFALILILSVAIFLHFRGGQKIDALKLLFSEMVFTAQINHDPFMLELYRVDSPPRMDRYVVVVEDAISKLISRIDRRKKGKSADIVKSDRDSLSYLKSLYDILHDFNSRIGRSRGVFMGSITGFNRINLYSNFVELYEADNVSGIRSFEVNGKSHTIPDHEYKGVENMLRECGGFLNIVVYEAVHGWKIPLLWKNKVTRAVLCFDDQLTGVNSQDGKIILHAPGIESHGFYFEIPSGSPDRTKVILSVIKSLTWIRATAQIQSNLFELVNNSLNMNPTLLQSLAIKQMEKPVAKPVKTE